MSDYWKKKLDELNKSNANSPSRTQGVSFSDYWQSKKSELEKEEEKKKAEKKTTTPITSNHGGSGGKFTASSDIAPVAEKRTWFQKGAFEDGYDFGDVTKTILGTGKDIRENIYAGIYSGVEGVIDAGAGIVGGIGGKFSKDFEKKTNEFIAKDIIQEEELAQMADSFGGPLIGNLMIGNPASSITNYASSISNLITGEKNISDVIIKDKTADELSVLGEKSDSVVQSGGLMIASAGLQSFGVPWQVTMGVTSYGSELENAIRNGATSEEAHFSAAVSAGAEILTGSLFRIPGVSGSGSGIVSQGVVGKLTQNISSTAVKNLVNWGVNILGEGAEEVITSFFQRLGQVLSYEREDTLRELVDSEEARNNYLQQVGEKLFGDEARHEYSEAFVGGAAMAGFGGSPTTISDTMAGRDSNTGLTADEKKVLDKLVEDEIKKREEDGKKLNKQQKVAIEEEIRNKMEKGYISAEDIESVLGGDSYTAFQTAKDGFFGSEEYQAYQKAVKAEEEARAEFDPLVKMKQGEMTGEQIYRRDELKKILDESKVGEMKSKLSVEANKVIDLRNAMRNDVMARVKDGYLAESYRELARKSEKFSVDISKYTDENAKRTVQNIIDSGLGDNTNQFHETVDFLAKMSADKGVTFSLTNNEQIRGTKHYKAGYVTNGFVTENGDVTLNMDSPKALNTTVGHEITHVMEQSGEYKALQEAVFNYAISKEGQAKFNERLQEAEEAYRDKKNTSPEAEVTADIIGEYLFTDYDFVQGLSTSNRNLFQKIYDEIKYMVKIATAGSKEARELEKVKKMFDKAYRENVKGKPETAADTSKKDNKDIKYSLSDELSPFQAQVLNTMVSNIKREAERNNISLLEFYDQTAEINAFSPTKADANKIADSLVPIVEQLDIENFYAYLDKIRSYSADTVNSEEATQNEKYSVSKDTSGNVLTAEQSEFFEDSKVVDDSGNLMVMYHGTPNGNFTVFKDGTYFTNNKEYADRYQNPGASSISTGKVAAAPKTYAVYLNIKKPFDIKDADARNIYINEYIKGGNAMGINPYLSDAEYAKINTIDWTEGEDLRDFLQDNGYDYDGLVLDEGADGGYGEAVNSRGVSYVVFSPEQVKDVGNKRPTADPDYRYSMTKAEKAKMDSDYMDAVKSGNTDVMEHLIREYAKSSMPKSKLVDENGNLRKVYHGTNTGDFTVFNPDYIGMSSGDDGFFGMGFYFAYSKGEASYYGAKRIIPAYLDLRNPFNFDTELQTYNGKKAQSGHAPDAVALMNFADKFPEIAKDITIGAVKNGESEVKEISAFEFAREYKDIIANKKFEYGELVNEYGESETIVTADPKVHEYEYNGETHSYRDYGFQKRWYGTPNEYDVAFEYLSNAVYSYIDIPRRTNIILDNNRAFTDELKRRGYDGAIQSEHGDEAVAFYPSQIKSAQPITKDDDGNVIPLSKRFDRSNDDIRYSVTKSELESEYQRNIDSENMAEAEKIVEQMAELSMPDSKIRGEDGKLLPVYHGTNAMFWEFDTSADGGKNGTAEGFGIYLSDNQEVTNAYGDRQIKMFANITKPATSFKKTITQGTLVKLIRDTCEKEAQRMVSDGEYDSVREAIRDTWVSNYADTYSTSMEQAYREVAQSMLQQNDNDKDIVHEVMFGMAIRSYDQAMDFYRNSLTPVTGFDGFITKWDNANTGETSNIYLAFDSSQLKSADAVTYDDDGNVISLSDRFNTEKGDIRYSLSKDGKEPNKHGNWHIYGSDFGVNDPISDFAPVKENLTTNATRNASKLSTSQEKSQLSEEKSTVSELERVDQNELFPDTPTHSLEDLEAEARGLMAAMEGAAAVGDLTRVEQLSRDYEAVSAEIAQLEEAERQRADSLYGVEAPPENDAPYYNEEQPTQVDNPFEDRDWYKVGNRKVKAYMYENPEVKPFFQEEALGLLGELNDTTKGERWYDDDLYYATGGEQGFGGTKRHTSASIAVLRDEWGMSYADIEKGLNAIVEDNGAENIAAAKKIEFMLNYRLLHGYKDFYSNGYIPPNQGYINLLDEKQVTEYSKEAFDSFMANADQYAPAEEFGPVAEATNEAEAVTEEAPYSDNITEAFNAITDEDAPTVVDNSPPGKITTVRDRVNQKIRNAQAELDKQRQNQEAAHQHYAEQIAKAETELASKKNQHTKLAENLRRRIEGLKRQQADIDATYEKRISDLEKRVEKYNSEEYSRAEYRRDVQDKMTKFWADTIGDTSTWKDLPLGLAYKTKTLRRILRAVVRDVNGNRDIDLADAIYDELETKYDHHEAQLKVESGKLKQVFADLKLTSAEDTYAQMLGEFRHNPETTLTQQRLDDYYDKHKRKIDTAKVDRAINEARKLYDDLIVRVNEVLKQQGMREIPYRDGYFPHFTNPKQNWLMKALNWKPIDTEVPTSIAGLTQDFKPQRSWQSFAQQRRGDTTDYSLYKGLDTYIHGALDWIYHIEDIQSRRSLENYIRFIHSDEGIQQRIKTIHADDSLDAFEVQDQINAVLAEAKNPLSGLVRELMNRTNTLAAKKSSMDREMEDMVNRKVYSTMTNLNNRVTANMVVGSFSSALTNFIPMVQSWHQVSPVYTVKGLSDMIRSTVHDDGTIEKSDFLTNRLVAEENLYKTGWDKVSDKAAMMMNVIDNITSQTVWRSKYLQNIHEGMSETQAIMDADQFAKNLIAGRSRGNMPSIFDAKNPLTKIFTAFQLEVANQYGYMFEDVPTDSTSKLRLVKGYATAFIGAYLFNSLYSALVGRNAAFDPIRIIQELFGDLQDDDDEEPEDVLLNFGKNILQEVPFVGGLLGGGRTPISSALPYT